MYKRELSGGLDPNGLFDLFLTFTIRTVRTRPDPQVFMEPEDEGDIAQLVAAAEAAETQASEKKRKALADDAERKRLSRAASALANNRPVGQKGRPRKSMAAATKDTTTFQFDASNWEIVRTTAVSHMLLVVPDQEKVKARIQQLLTNKYADVIAAVSEDPKMVDTLAADRRAFEVQAMNEQQSALKNA